MRMSMYTENEQGLLKHMNK